MIINMQVILPVEDEDKLDLIILVLIILIEIMILINLIWLVLDYIHPPRGVERRAKLGAGHSESINADYIKYYIYNISI